jgi:transposase-like protein
MPKHRNTGKWGRKSVQRYRCRDCRATFSEQRPKPLGNHYTPIEKGAKIIELLERGHERPRRLARYGRDTRHDLDPA